MQPNIPKCKEPVFLNQNNEKKQNDLEILFDQLAKSAMSTLPKEKQIPGI